MTTLAQSIRTYKPGLAETTLTTYISYLRTLSGQILETKRPEANELKPAFLTKYARITKQLASAPITTRKSILTAVIVALKSQPRPNKATIAKYKQDLMALNATYNKTLETQTKTPKQARNWIDYDTLQSIPSKISTAFMKELGDAPPTPDMPKKAFDLLQQYVMISTYLAFPIRNNFAEMKIVDPEHFVTVGNILLVNPDGSMKFYIRDFKTKQSLGEQVMQIPAKLRDILTLWLTVNTSKYLFVNILTRQPMKGYDITAYMNKLFHKWAGKCIGSTMLRHILISHDREGQPPLIESKATESKAAAKYHHSSAMNQLYRKIA